MTLVLEARESIYLEKRQQIQEKRQQAFESEQKGKTLAQASGYDRQNSDTIDDFFDS